VVGIAGVHADDPFQVVQFAGDLRHGPPPPQAMPTAALTHTPAAVASPRTASRRRGVAASRRTKMMPPPMKPIPETICAATREGARDVCRKRTPSANPKDAD
jgi:hypothetical protein